MTSIRPRTRRAARLHLAAWLALLVAGTASPVAGTASPVAAQSVPTMAGIATVPLTGRGPEDASGGAELAGGGVTEDLASVHWEQAEEHAMDIIAFEPGGLVTAPFKPRGSDRWEVDGAAPVALPAGHATGRQMREAAQNSIWAAGAPGNSGDAPGVAGELDRTVDQPAGPVDAGGAPAAASGPANGASIAVGPVTAAPVSSTGLRREVFGFLP